VSVFRDAEIAYLGSQRLGRLATVGRDGMPHVVPVAFRYNRQAGHRPGRPCTSLTTGVAATGVFVVPKRRFGLERRLPRGRHAGTA
jgi:hypothetical protein